MLSFRLWYLNLPKVTRFILALYGAVFLVCLAVLWRIPAVAELLESHLVLGSSWWREPWQLLTYSLIDSGSLLRLIHLAIGLFWLFWIGSEVEEMRGSDVMLSLWCFSILVGGLTGAMLAPTVGFEAPAFRGIYAGVIGVLVAMCLWYPEKRLWVIFVGPVRLWYFVIVLVLIELIRPTSGLVSVGGGASAWLFVWLDRRELITHTWASHLIRASKRMPRAVWSSAEHSKRQERKSPSATEASMEEIDRILDKISAQGINSLTDSERKVLEDASRQ